MIDVPLSLMARLKRHHIFRVASVYAIVAWVLIQVANGVFPDIGLTRADVRFVIAAVALLFPVALVLGWMFIPPSKDNPDKFSHWQHIRFRVGSVLALIIVVLAILSGIFLWRTNERYLKAEAVAAAAVKASAVTPAPGAATVIPAKSIAVLPFANLSGDPKQVYFSDGITEEILNALAQIPDLKVAARTSAFAFKGKDENLHTIGQILGVATVLEGSVQKAGDEVRITVQLVDTRSGYQLWSENYDRKLTNIFAIEDEISKAIASKLRVQWSGGTSQPLVAQQTIDPRAHDFYLRGLALLAARGPGLRDAVAAFQSAVKIAPNYAQAWGELAVTETQLSFYVTESLDTMLTQAQSDARHALALNQGIAPAYVALGVVHSLRWQWVAADRAFRRALVLAPGDAEAADQYAQFLDATGQLEPALHEIERAQRLDPLAPICGVYRASILQALHRFDDAEAQIKTNLKAHPDFVFAHFDALMFYISQHRYADAEAQMRLMAQLSGVDPDAEAFVIRGIGNAALRTASIHSLETAPGNAFLRRDPILHAMLLVWLDQRSRALEVLEGNLVSRASLQTQLLWMPAFDPIRDDPHFKAVLKKMGLPYTPKGLSPVCAACTK